MFKSEGTVIINTSLAVLKLKVAHLKTYQLFLLSFTLRKILNITFNFLNWFRNLVV